MHPSLTRRNFLLRSAAGLGVVGALSAKSRLPWVWAAPAGRFSGIFAILQTPFNPSDQLDWEDLGREVDFCVRAGAHGLVWPQLAGEFYLLSEDECLHGTEVILRTVAGHRPVHALLEGLNKPPAGAGLSLQACGFARQLR